MIPMQAKLIAIGIAALVVFMAGWKVNGWRYEAQIAEAEKARQAMIDAYREEEVNQPHC